MTGNAGKRNRDRAIAAASSDWLYGMPSGYLVNVAEAAMAYVATTSYFRQPKESRSEFEDLAVALFALRQIGGKA